MQRSVFYRPTGNFAQRGQKLPLFAIVRNNEIFEPEFLEDTRGKSLHRGGRLDGELDMRLNTAGDSVDSATGYQIAIDTLTFLTRQISEQKFYKIAPADFVPIMVGEGAFAQDLLFNRTYSVAEDFEAGIVRQGTADARLSTADVAIDGVAQKTNFWAKSINYTIIEIEQALRANAWDPIMMKMSSRKENWDLGIQVTAFLGLATDATNFPGLITNTAWTTDSSTSITKAISSMSAAELLAFQLAFLAKYWSNAAQTAMPDTFLMPTTDFIACSQIMTPATLGTYPTNLLDWLHNAFKKATQNPNFKILHTPYCDASINNTLRALNHHYYLLYRQDPKSLRMNIPIDLTVLQANTINNFQFQSVAYGQFTGVVALRSLECVVFYY